jgi:hypothetical protein
MSPTISKPDLSRRFVTFGWILLALLPVAYIATQVVAASRNIVFWDEIDTALDLVIRINAGADWHELVQRFFAVDNEHRMVTSRLLYAVSYWLTGTLNFHFIGAVGNLCLVGACVALVAAVRETERRIRLGVILAFAMFQLEHFESFLWSGSSIDHFQVVMLAMLALIALSRGTRGGVMAGAGFGLLATFTLAHGCMVWPVGFLLLWHQRRWNHLAFWTTCSIAATSAFLYGFEFNPGHRISEITLVSVGHVARFWLALLGGPVTLGHAELAPYPGFLLLAGLGGLLVRGALHREPVAMSGAMFAVGSLALVAFGRTDIASAEINSRYLVLGALAWALFIFMGVEAITPAARPYRVLAWLVPAFVVFNVSANRHYAPKADGFIEVRDRAATAFFQHGEDGHDVSKVRLHPRTRHADILLRIAADRGIYRLPVFSKSAEFSGAQPSQRIVAHVDETVANDRAVTVGGWGMIPGVTSEFGQIQVVLRSEQSTRVFTTVTLQRPDVAKAYQEPKWRLAGFRAVIPREQLPRENFTIGVMIVRGGRAEYVMTPRQLTLVPTTVSILSGMAASQ